MGQGGKGHRKDRLNNRTKNRSLDQNIGPTTGHIKATNGQTWYQSKYSNYSPV